MEENTLDRMLQENAKAAMQSIDGYYEKLTSEVKVQPEWSKDFQDQIDRILNPEKYSHKKRWAAAAAAAALAAGVVLTPVGTRAVEEIKQFMRINYTVENGKTEITEIGVPQYLPAGLEQSMGEFLWDERNFYWSRWHDKDWKHDLFMQQIANGGGEHTMGWTGSLDKVRVNGITYYVTTDNETDRGHIDILWVQGGYTFTLGGGYSKEELLKIAESVHLKKE